MVSQTARKVNCLNRLQSIFGFIFGKNSHLVTTVVMKTMLTNFIFAGGEYCRRQTICC